MSALAPDIGIVGGGILGMALARRLASGGAPVTIVEGAARLGGLTAPAEIGGFTWDRFYHVILGTDSHLLGLIREIGLEDHLRWAPTRTGFYIDGRLHSLSSALDFALFPALSPIAKLRLAATVLRAARIRDWKPLEKILATEWLRRWSGPRTLERVWLPLLRAKLGANAERASAAFIWAIIARMYGARNTAAKREHFGYVTGGYSTLLTRIEADLESRGIRRRQGAQVTRVESGSDGVSLHLESGDSLTFDAVVLTIPCAHIARLCPQLTDAERARLRGVTYQGIICASLLLKRPLAGYYVTNVTDSWVPFTGIIEMTALVDREWFGGHSLVYLPRYVTQDDPMWQREDHSIIEEFTAALERMYPGFRRGDIAAGHVSRVREMLAVSTVGYSEELAPSVRTTIPNVYVVNSAQILNGTLNVNETLGLAEEKLPELERYLRATTGTGQAQGGLA